MRAIRRAVMRAAARVVVGTLALPDPVLRLAGGSPIRVDGAELSPTAQLLTRLEGLVPRVPPPHLADLARAREEFDLVSTTMLKGVGRAVATWDVTVPGADGPLRARIYTPPGMTGPAPALLYLHGGGFVGEVVREPHVAGQVGDEPPHVGLRAADERLRGGTVARARTERIAGDLGVVAAQHPHVREVRAARCPRSPGTSLPRHPTTGE